jgi:hypothetical protein
MADHQRALAPALRNWLAFRLRGHALTPDGSRLPVYVDSDHDGMPRDVAIERTRRGIRLSLSRNFPIEQLTWSRGRFRGYIHWFAYAQPGPTRITVNTSDGDVTSTATFAPSARPDRHVLIVDPHFYKHRGYDWATDLFDESPQWSERSDEIVWRGARTGLGRHSLYLDDADDPTVLPRYRLVMKLKDVPGCNVRLAPSKYTGHWADDERRLGFLGDRVDQTSWSTRKFAIDIDGATNAWSNFMVRLKLGCCVLKIESPHGFKQWFYDRIRPFEHYVPVKPDMSDLLQKIEWVRSNDSQAREIAKNGQAVARLIDFESGRREAVDIIRNNWKT